MKALLRVVGRRCTRHLVPRLPRSTAECAAWTMAAALSCGCGSSDDSPDPPPDTCEDGGVACGSGGDASSTGGSGGGGADGGKVYPAYCKNVFPYSIRVRVQPNDPGDMSEEILYREDDEATYRKAVGQEKYDLVIFDKQQNVTTTYSYFFSDGQCYVDEQSGEINKDLSPGFFYIDAAGGIVQDGESSAVARAFLVIGEQQYEQTTTIDGLFCACSPALNGESCEQLCVVEEPCFDIALLGTIYNQTVLELSRDVEDSDLTPPAGCESSR